MVQFETEGFLTQLGYPTSEANKRKLKSVINNTGGFNEIEKHVIQLNDTLKSYQSYVTLSNNKDLLKIKKDIDSKITEENVDTIIQNWAQKYKVSLIYQPRNNSYYITGKA